MGKEFTAEETAIIATYSNRHDAEAAKSFLDAKGISSFVAADDVHPPLQITEWVRLRVMSGKAERAREILEDSGMLPGDQANEMPVQETGKSTRLTVWGYIAVFVLILVLILVGLVF